MKKSEQTNLTFSTKKNSNYEWRRYGTLEVNLSKWEDFEGSVVTPAINKSGKPLLIAINCKSSKLTWRGSKGDWKKWFSPIDDYEFKLLDQLCENTNQI